MTSSCHRLPNPAGWLGFIAVDSFDAVPCCGWIYVCVYLFALCPFSPLFPLMSRDGSHCLLVPRWAVRFLCVNVAYPHALVVIGREMCLPPGK